MERVASKFPMRVTKFAPIRLLLGLRLLAQRGTSHASSMDDLNTKAAPPASPPILSI
jgi:hypothetical protein